jgi:hypothetical protein
MPIARTKADTMCLAVYTLAGGKILRGFMVKRSLIGSAATSTGHRPWPMRRIGRLGPA